MAGRPPDAASPAGGAASPLSGTAPAGTGNASACVASTTAAAPFRAVATSAGPVASAHRRSWLPGPSGKPWRGRADAGQRHQAAQHPNGYWPLIRHGPRGISTFLVSPQPPLGSRRDAGRSVEPIWRFVYMALDSRQGGLVEFHSNGGARFFLVVLFGWCCRGSPGGPSPSPRRR